MRNKVVDIDTVKEVAAGLKNLRPNFAFVGGSIVGLYIDDPSADKVRQTMDVDLSISLKGYGEWARLQDELAQLGFWPDSSSKVICRYLYKGITVDIMPDDEKILGFSNPWYKPGLAKVKPYRLSDAITINLLPLPYFIATKFSALNGRGKGYHWTSHDFEDIVYVTDNVTNVVQLIAEADEDVRDFLKAQYKVVRDHENRRDIITAHLLEQMKDARYQTIIEKIQQIVV